jgi:acyl-CoA synthetase (NDP forming)/GNAT superfamily N-acetyltransferase
VEGVTVAFPDSDALLVDARIAHIRPGGPADLAAVRALHDRLSPESLFLRYFSGAPALEGYLQRLLRPVDADHQTLLVELTGEVVAVAAYERLQDRTAAEVAFLVDDSHQGLGIGTLLLEHLAASAAANGVTRFVAETLPANAAMLAVFRDAGFPVDLRREDGVVHVEFPVTPDETALAAAEEREGLAEHRSLAQLLRPVAVTVVGAGSDPSGLGHQVMANLVAGGFDRPMAAVNRSGQSVCGVPAFRSLADVPDPVDLVVVAVPAAGVVEVARQAAARGAHSLVVISAGFAEAGPTGADAQHELLAVCRAAGMRLVGPNCMGVFTRDGSTALNATFCATAPPAGGVGLLSQSGALGIAVMDYAARTGIGLANFVSAGNKADVSGNDLLCFWERDSATQVCALYLESFGNPRKFSRIARRVGRSKPVVVVKSGRSAAGRRGAASHTAAAASPDITVDALFEQAGVVRAQSLAELFDIVTLLDRAPLPAGNRVAIVGNSGGPGVLAADACTAAGLLVPELTEETQHRLAALLPAGAAVANPVDLIAGASPAALSAALTAVLADPTVDAVIAIYTPVGDGTKAMAAAMANAGRRASKPVLAVLVAVPEAPPELRDAAGRLALPYYAFPEPAARALSAVVRYAAWRTQPAGTSARLEGIDRAAARAVVAAHLHARPDGGWLPAVEAAELVGCYGIPVLPTLAAGTADAAVAAADEVGWPVAVKAGELLHKTDQGGVVLNLADEAALRAAYADLRDRLGGGPVVVQPMADAGVETAAGVVADPAFGPLVMFGLGGVASELLADRTFRILPLSQEDAAAQVRGLRAARLLFGYRGSPPVAVPALENLLLRLGRLAEDVPEIAELDLNPVLARPEGVVAVDVKVRLAPALVGFPLLRRLRS